MAGSVGKRMSNHVSRGLRVADHISKMSRLSYRMSERASLMAAHRSNGAETDVLDFRVSFLNQGAFRIALAEIFFDGIYLFQAETDAPRILDCGANIGLAMLFFKHLYPKARIASFEADPTTFAVLQKNVEQNHLEGVTAHNLMLSNGEGSCPFYVGTDCEGSLQMSAMPDRLTGSRQILVAAGKLSTYVDGPIDLLKLDVEGSEFDVLTDLIESGKIALIRKMVIEYHHKAGGQASCLSRFLQMLEEHGFDYQLAGICDPITSENEMQDLMIGAYRR